METVVTKLNEGTSELQQFDYNTLSSELLKNNFFGHVDFGLSRNLVDPIKLILNTEAGIVLDHVLEYLCFIGYLTKKGLDINSYLTLNFGVQIHIAIFIYQFLKKTPLGSPFIGYFFKSLGVHDSLSGYITKDSVQDTRPLKETIDFNTGTDVMLVSEEIIRKFTGVNDTISVPFKMNYLQLKNLILGYDQGLESLFKNSLSNFTSMQILILSQSYDLIRSQKNNCLFQNSYMGMQQGIYLAINSQIFDNFKIICEKGSDLNYVVMSELVSRYYEAGVSNDNILKKEYGDMISYAIESGAEIDNYQLKYLSLQADADLITRIKDNYSRPLWEKLCKVRELDAGSIANQKLRTLAFDLNIDFSSSPERICQKLQEISNMDRITFFKESVERQKERISELTKELIPSNERRECDPKTTLVNNPYAYNDARISFYVDDYQNLWCFTSDMFESLIKSQVNPYTGSPLPEIFVQTLKSQINLLESLKVKNTNTNLNETLEVAFQKNKEISNENSDAEYNVFINTCLMYGVGEKDFRIKFLKKPRWSIISLFSILFSVNCKDIIDPLIFDFINKINFLMLQGFDTNDIIKFVSIYLPSLKIFKLYSTSYITRLNFENSGELYFRTIGCILMDIFRKITIGRYIDYSLKTYKESKFYEGKISESIRKLQILGLLTQ